MTLVDADNQPRSDKSVNVAKFPDDGKNVAVGSASHYQAIAAAAALRRVGEAAASVAKLDELRVRHDAELSVSGKLHEVRVGKRLGLRQIIEPHGADWKQHALECVGEFAVSTRRHKYRLCEDERQLIAAASELGQDAGNVRPREPADQVFVPSHGGLHERRGHTGEDRDIRMLVSGV